VGGIDRGIFPLSATRAEPSGYLPAAQTRDGRIQLISSKNYYVFNVAWLRALPHSRRHLAEIEGDQIFFAPPEYVILRKLQFYREGKSTNHLRDIHRMINILGPEWDKQELLILIREHRVEPEWQAALECND
jgi:hypothetical protein